MTFKYERRRMLLAMGAGICAPLLARAETYPSRPLRIIVPVAAGGGTDFSARLIAQKLAPALGQSVIVENRPGASGNIGAELAARAAPDGYTLVMPITSFPVNPSLFRSMPFDTEKDFAPIALVGVLPLVLVVHPSVPARTASELIDLARKKPGTLNFANSGNGTTAHLAGELFRRMALIDIVSVNYKGGGPAVTELLGGQVQMYFATIPSVLAHIQTGKLKAVALTGKQRFANLPDVPTVDESGVPGFDVTAWFGLFAPAGTPAAITRRLNREVLTILQVSEMQQTLSQHGVLPGGGSEADLGRHLGEEVRRWQAVVRDAGIKTE